MILFLDLFLSDDSLACPYCGEKFSAPGVDVKRVHTEKKSWFFSTSNPTICCPHCKCMVEIVPNSWWS